MTVINTNVASLYAQAAITTNSRRLTNTMQELSTGKRINGAADDAAGIAISAKLTSQIKGLNQAIRNANDAISMIQTAEGATDAITNMLQRMRELSVQAGNASYSNDDRSAMAAEFDALVSEIDRVANTTKWNGFNVLDGLGGASGNGTFQFDVDSGSGNSGLITLQIGSFLSTNATGINIGSSQTLVAAAPPAAAVTATIHNDMTASNVQKLIARIDTAIGYVNSQRSAMGSVINRLQYTLDNLTNIETNTEASRSRIEDADYASTTADLAKHNIIAQAATAMLAQANQQPQTVLQLLKQ